MRLSTALLAIGAGLLVLAPPFAAGAQPPGKTYKLGFLMSMDPVPEWQLAFKQGLAALGWSEGRNIAIEYRSADGHFDRLPRLCAERIGLRVDLILAVSAPETAAAKQCTSTIPIVFAIHGDPVGTGDVESLAHPGGNATGMSQTQGEVIPLHSKMTLANRLVSTAALTLLAPIGSVLVLLLCIVPLGISLDPVEYEAKADRHACAAGDRLMGVEHRAPTARGSRCSPRPLSAAVRRPRKTHGRNLDDR